MKLKLSQMLGLAIILIAAAAASSVILAPAGASSVRQYFHPDVVVTSGTTAAPIIEAINGGKGPGLEGISTGGTAMIGKTYFKSTSTSNAAAAVLGLDQSSTGNFNFGVEGQSPRGTGVHGTSSNGTGVSGITGNLTGITSAVSGVVGSSFYPGNPGQYGALGVTTIFSPGGQGFPFLNESIGYGVYGTGTTGVEGVGIPGQQVSCCYDGGIGVAGYGIVGLWAQSTDVVPLTAGLESTAIYAQQQNDDSLCEQDIGQPCDVVYATGPESPAMSLDEDGNMILAGKLTQNGTPQSVRRAPSGARVTTYSAQQTSPSIEDFGTGQIVNGQGSVAIAADFAAVINKQAGYLVFLTPNGDNRGLYVASRSPNGFIVRESQGGHSNLSFDYRIVARPSGEQISRLAPAKTIRLMRLAAPRPYYPPGITKVR